AAPDHEHEVVEQDARHRLGVVLLDGRLVLRVEVGDGLLVGRARVGSRSCRREREALDAQDREVSGQSHGSLQGWKYPLDRHSRLALFGFLNARPEGIRWTLD